MLSNKLLRRIYFICTFIIVFNYTNSNQKVEAKVLGNGYNSCGPDNSQLCFVVEFGEGWYFYGYGKE